MTPVRTLIEIRDLEKFYYSAGSGEDVQALRAVNLDVRHGEFLSILGPSGCGKSTLLRIIDGLLPFDAGTATIGSEPIVGPGPDRAFVFQQFALLPWATVMENVLFPLEVRKVDKSERRRIGEQALTMVGLLQFKDHYPRTLSGGMQQRVGLARALVVDPEILLMDEPFGALDSLTRAGLQEELNSIWSGVDTKKTAVFVTHSIDEAVYLSDRIALMTPRPGTVAEIVDVPIDRRERSEDVRDDPRFVETVSYIRRRIKEFTTAEATL